MKRAEAYHHDQQGGLQCDEAHLELFTKLQEIDLINSDKEPEPGLQGKVFSDVELRQYLKKFNQWVTLSNRAGITIFY